MSKIWRPLTQHATAEKPLKILRAKGATLFLEDGRELLDCISGWWFTNVGRGHPQIARAIYEQACKCEHLNFADFTHEPGEALAERVLDLLPSGFTHAFYSDNGSTSVEVALKLALQYWSNQGVTRRKCFIRFEEGYHGDTFGAMAVGHDSPYFHPFSDLLFPTESLPYPTTPELEKEALVKLANRLASRPETYAGCIIEPLIQGAGGMRFCSPSFLRALEQLAKAHELLIIYDEVMTGFGRTGEWFACTKARTQPDLICLSKGLSGGYLPLAMTCATEQIYQAFLSEDPYKTFAHSHSFGGSALGCAAGLAALDLMQGRPFALFEAWHRPRMERLAKLPGVHNARVLGTCAAFEIETDEADGYYNPIGKRIKGYLMERGIYLRPLGNTLYLLPPYCMTEVELDRAYAALEEAISWASKPSASKSPVVISCA